MQRKQDETRDEERNGGKFMTDQGRSWQRKNTVIKEIVKTSNT